MCVPGVCRRQDMEKRSVLLDLYEGNPPVTGGVPSQNDRHEKPFLFVIRFYKMLNRSVEFPVIWDAMALIIHHCHVLQKVSHVRDSNKKKWLNLITAPGSVSNEPGSVTWLATKYLKTVSWRNHTEKLTTFWPQNISFWPKINIPSSYFTILMLNC